MKRNKYLNTFDNTADYENYIESALPGFPNVGLTKDNGELHYMRTSPNDHVWYGEVVDPAQALPTITLNNKTNNTTLDELTNTFYLDSWSNAAPTSISFNNKSNLKTIKKLKGLDTSNVTKMEYTFNNCSSLTTLDLSIFNTSNVTTLWGTFTQCSALRSLDLSNWDTSKVIKMYQTFKECSALTSLNLSNWNTSNVNDHGHMFSGCSSLTDVYITVEATLNMLTNNLTSQGDNYIPSSATIHYNGVDYKWTGSAWTQQ